MNAYLEAQLNCEKCYTPLCKDTNFAPDTREPVVVVYCDNPKCRMRGKRFEPPRVQLAEVR